MSNLEVATEFSRYLGGRFKNDGPFSGEEFRDSFLIPRLEQAQAQNRKLLINFDGVAGMPSSFLEEAFGGLIRHFRGRSTRASDSIEFRTSDPELLPFIALAQRFMRQETDRH